MSTSTLRAPSAPAKRTKAKPHRTAETVLCEWAIGSNYRTSIHRDICQVREKFGVAGWAASYHMAIKVKEVISVAIWEYPSDELMEAAIRSLLKTARWARVAGLLSDHFTPELCASLDSEIERLNTEAESDATAASARVAEADEELTQLEGFPRVVSLV